jgi:hypothetical protein
MSLKYSLPLICLVLAGCGSQMETVTVLPDEYEISASPPAGMYGGWIALSPDGDALAKEASARCPSGYKVVNQEVGQGHFATDYIRWDILCQPLQQGSAPP